MTWDIPKALELLKQGELIAFKTDTVPGIACDPLNPEAVKKVYQLKGRAQDKPLVIMMGDVERTDYWTTTLSSDKWRLLQEHWPGNLTVIFRRCPMIPDIFNSDTIALRIPDKDILRELIRQFGKGLAVTSANISGQKELLTMTDVEAIFGDQIALYLDDVEPQSGVPSTVIDLQGNTVEVLRGEFGGH